MFIDRVEIHCQAGNGGDGCISFRREKYVPRGGPNGGDGGDGGSIIVRAERNLGSLTNIVGHRQWKAQHGAKGLGSLKTGASGADSIILVPPGTLVKDLESGDVLHDLATTGTSSRLPAAAMEAVATNASRRPSIRRRGPPKKASTARLAKCSWN